MDKTIIERLNSINQEFYKVTASDFNQTRSEAWQGWQKLLPYLGDFAGPLNVLDVGCGNGRFGLFLHQNLPQALDYTGIDNNSQLLAYAHHALTEANFPFTLEHQDVITQPFTLEKKYHVIVAFGVIHHIPSLDYRQTFLKRLAEGVALGGLLVFASWRFYEYPRFRERIVAWDESLASHIEHHDYLLDWQRGESALRYCHYVDDSEQEILIRATGLTLLETYRADGKTDDLNCYSILRRTC
jgi:2-polyprenyl-3-methyl-5-hydroxy-6-metoxy-1,4-benzoquinol methylase